MSVLLVFIAHCSISEISDLRFVFGRIGVVCFVMMSGYLATTSLQKRSTGRFLVNRCIRIYPLYWLVLTIYALLLFGNDEYSLLDYLANMTLFEEYIGFPIMILPTWMLSILLMSYVVMTIIDKRKQMLADLFFAAICVVAIVAGAIRHVTGISLPVAVPLLMLLTLSGYQIRKETQKLWHWLAIAVTLPVAIILSYPDMILEYIAAYFLGIALFLFFRHKNVSIGIADGLGRISYPFYLCPVIPGALLKLLYPKFYETGNDYVLTALLFVSTLLLAYIVSRYIEFKIQQKGAYIEALIK